MSGSVVGTSDLPLELKGDPSCSEPDPDSLNLSSPPMNAPDLAPSTPPAERVRAWAHGCSGPDGSLPVLSKNLRFRVGLAKPRSSSGHGSAIRREQGSCRNQRGPRKP